jgi:hypothetical protein
MEAKNQAELSDRFESVLNVFECVFTRSFTRFNYASPHSGSRTGLPLPDISPELLRASIARPGCPRNTKEQGGIEPATASLGNWRSIENKGPQGPGRSLLVKEFSSKFTASSQAFS